MTTSSFKLGDYRTVPHSPLLLLALEPFIWTFLGLANRKGHQTSTLAKVAALHSAHGMWIFVRLVNDPKLIENNAWVARHSALSVLRYLIYPTIATKRTYWRTSADNTAFFMQTWTPVVLVGANRGPRDAVIAGAGIGVGAYAAAAMLNGEPPLPLGRFGSAADWMLVTRRVANYSITSALLGAFVASIGALLRDAADVINDQQDALVREHLDRERQVQKERSLARVHREIVRTTELLGRVVDDHFAERQELQGMKDALHKARTTQLAVPDLGGGNRFDNLADESRTTFAVKVEVEIGSDVILAERDCQIAWLVLRNAVSNAKSHGRAETVRVGLREDGNHWFLRIVDDGEGLKGAPSLRPWHGLGRARMAVRRLGGDLTVVSIEPDAHGTEVHATWTKQTQMLGSGF